MDDCPFTDLLLRAASAVTLRLDDAHRLLQISNAALYQDWLPASSSLPVTDTPLAALLQELFSETQTARLLQDFSAGGDPPSSASVTCEGIPARPSRLMPPRWFDLTLVRLSGEPPAASLLLIADRTALHTLTAAVAEARAAEALTLAVLRSDPATLRQFLHNAGSAVGFIRTTLRQPARTQEAARTKLRHLRNEADSLGAAAARLALQQVEQPAQQMVTALDALLAREATSGDDMLPLALHIDALSGAISAIAALEEQRVVPAAPAPRAAVREAPAWHEVCEQRAGDQLSRMATELGVLVRLRMKGAALVPERYHRKIDAILEDLIDNAVRHGIETPQERIKADKPAAGTITITFRDRGAAGLEMTVHDDGRGFDLERIRNAAIACGFAQDGETLEPRDLVGLIFTPGLSCAPSDGQAGSGHSMALLRESLRRQGGNISVATKLQRYTQFSVHFAATDGVRRPAARNIAVLTR
ncbi:MAG: ATP-binding protein [Steroidobacteraceae bacterium]